MIRHSRAIFAAGLLVAISAQAETAMPFALIWKCESPAEP